MTIALRFVAGWAFANVMFWCIGWMTGADQVAPDEVAGLKVRIMLGSAVITMMIYVMSVLCGATV